MSSKYQHALCGLEPAVCALATKGTGTRLSKRLKKAFESVSVEEIIDLLEDSSLREQWREVRRGIIAYKPRNSYEKEEINREGPLHRWIDSLPLPRQAEICEMFVRALVEIAVSHGMALANS